jgi:hypothetical protein
VLQDLNAAGDFPHEVDLQFQPGTRDVGIGEVDAQLRHVVPLDPLATSAPSFSDRRLLFSASARSDSGTRCVRLTQHDMAMHSYGH